MMSETRSFGIQCDSKRSTGVQTKRLSKDEMRYFTKVIEKEREVLLKFTDATRGYLPQLYKVDIVPGHKATKVLKKYGARKKPKRKNKRKHSMKAAHQVEKVEKAENFDRKEHYVSKIVVDDSTRSLKLSLKTCRSRKSSPPDNEFKENKQTIERARARKAKRPRRVCRVVESGLSTFSEDRMGTASPAPRPLPPKKEHVPTFAPRSDNLLSSNNPRNVTASTESADENYNVVQMIPEKKKTDSLLTSPNKDNTLSDQFTTSAYSEEDTSYVVSASDDDQSDCSEEFSIVEPSEAAVRNENTESIIATQSTLVTTSASDDTVMKETPNTSMKSELKKRLQANLIRKQIDNKQQHNTDNEKEIIRTCDPGSDLLADEVDGLPQVVSVHFYDPQNQCQRVIAPNTHITQYAASDGTHVMLNKPASPRTSLTPPLRSVVVTTQNSFEPLHNTTTQSPVGALLSQDSPTNVSSTQYRFPQYQQHPNGIHSQSPTVTYSSSVNNHSRSTMRTGYHSSYPTQSVSENISQSPEVGKSSPAVSTNSLSPVSVSGSVNSITDTVNRDRESDHKEDSKPHENNQVETETGGTKRKRFIFGSDESPRKKVISSLLTPLCEREAIRLADGIHDINMQYFPLRSLAQKAASRASEDTDDVLKLIDQKIQLKTKVQDVEKARNLLKDIYDMVLKSKEIEDIQNFELVSHNFGVRNILNHLSLVDLYFGELGSELQSKI